MRSYRDLWLWLGAALLTLVVALVGIALAYFTKEQNFSLYTSWQMLASAAAFVAAFTCFFCAMREIPFPPWAKISFPDINIEVYRVSDINTQYTLSNGMALPASLKSYRVRITNIEREQNSSLTIILYLGYEPGSAGRIGEEVGKVPDWPINPAYGLNTITMPIVLPPGTTAGGDLVYEISLWPGAKLADPRIARFELVDHVSKQRMNLRMPSDIGNYSRRDLTPSQGGIKILGSEYEIAAEPLDNAAGTGNPVESAGPSPGR